jgi:hypothetical protein
MCPSDKIRSKIMKLNSFIVRGVIASISILGFSALATIIAKPAHAAISFFQEPPTGDPSRNNSAVTPDNTGINLPATGDAILIGGTLKGDGSNTGDIDWFSFMIQEAGTLSLSFQSSQIPTAALQASLYAASDPTTPLTLFRNSAPTVPVTSLSFNTPGGDGARVGGEYSIDTRFLVQIFGDATNNPNYSFQAELQPLPTTPVPTPALLPGLLGMGAAAWRKRVGKAAVSSVSEA